MLRKTTLASLLVSSAMTLAIATPGLAAGKSDRAREAIAEAHAIFKIRRGFVTTDEAREIYDTKSPDARRMFERLLALRNDVGLLAEGYDPRLERQVGNFPQGFSHIALLSTAFNLSYDRQRGVKRPATQRIDGEIPTAPSPS